jgi:hypothetical protein
LISTILPVLLPFCVWSAMSLLKRVSGMGAR